MEDGEGTEEEKEGDRHPSRERSPQLFSRGCAYARLFGLQLRTPTYAPNQNVLCRKSGTTNEVCRPA